MENEARECEWHHAPEACRRFWGFWKSQLVELRLDTWREGSTFGAHRGQTNLRATGAAWDGGGGGWQSQNRKNVYLSPYIEPLNSKVIKSFIPELRSHECFLCFEIPMFYVYVYEHAMYVSHMAFIMAMSHRFISVFQTIMHNDPPAKIIINSFYLIHFIFLKFTLLFVVINIFGGMCTL